MSRFNTFKVDKHYMDVMYEIMENDGELTPDLEKQLQITEDNFEFMAIQAKRFRKYAKAEASIIQDEIKRLQEIKKKYEQRADGVVEMLQNSMNLRGIERFKNDEVNIYPVTRKSLEVDEDIDIEQIQDEFVKKEISKSSITAALKEGTEVPFCKLVDKTSLTIR